MKLVYAHKAEAAIPTLTGHIDVTYDMNYVRYVTFFWASVHLAIARQNCYSWGEVSKCLLTPNRRVA